MPGSPVAAVERVLIRARTYSRSVVMMSVPFAGRAALPFNTANSAAPPRPPARPMSRLDAELAKLTPPAEALLSNCQPHAAGQTPTCCMRRRNCTPSSLPITTTRAADWADSRPHPAQGAHRRRRWRRFPTYYVMELRQGHGGHRCAHDAVGGQEVAASKWLAEAEVEESTRPNMPAPIYWRAAGLSCAGGTTPKTSLRCIRLRAAPSMCRQYSSAAKAGLGRLSNPGRRGRMQKSACTRMLGFRGWRGRRPLGAAGAAQR